MLQGKNDIEMQATSMSPSGSGAESYNDQQVCHNVYRRFFIDVSEIASV